MHFDQKVTGSNPTLAATKVPWANPSLAVACSASACKLWHSVNCCGRERFWKAHAGRSAIEMDKYNTIQHQRVTNLCLTNSSKLVFITVVELGASLSRFLEGPYKFLEWMNELYCWIDILKGRCINVQLQLHYINDIHKVLCSFKECHNMLRMIKMHQLQLIPLWADINAAAVWWLKY